MVTGCAAHPAGGWLVVCRGPVWARQSPPSTARGLPGSGPRPLWHCKHPASLLPGWEKLGSLP